MNTKKNINWTYGMKSIGILTLGACLGFILGSTVEFVRNLGFDKHYEFEDD